MWTVAFPLSELPPGGARLYKSPQGGIAVFRTEAGEVRAVDNRCPHEGYPLVTGLVRGETLTCAWHNFKFDLCSGACLQGDESVRAWPARVRDGLVEVDLTPADPSIAIAARLRSLEGALLERRPGQIARDVVRLLDLGLDPRRIAIFGAVFDGDRGEYGPSHAMAALVDAVAFAEERSGLQRALPLVLALEIAAEAQTRRPLRARPEPRTPPAPALALRAAVEAEDAATAEGIVRGALAAGTPATTVLGWLDPCLADHFLDFGHARIYQEKLFALLAWGPTADEIDRILGAHVYGIVNGTREDTLPPWSGWARRLAAADLSARDERTDPLPPDALVDLSAGAALDRVLEGDASAEAVLDALTVAASERLYRFDPAIDADVTIQDDWLTVTHRLTFVEALRAALPRLGGMDRWRSLAQATWFVAKAAAVDGPRLPVVPLPVEPTAESDLLDAIRARDAARAVGIAAGLWQAGERARLRAALMRVPMELPGVRPIVVAHAMKALVAADREAMAVDDPRPLLALARWYASPMVEQRGPQRVYEAIRLQVEGRPPKRLAD